MKRKTKNKIKDKLLNLTADLLESLYFAGGDTFLAAISKKEAFRIFNENYYHKYTETPFTKWLDRLRRQGYISYAPGSTSFEFTSKTKIKLAKAIGSRIGESNNYHFISFDIPEPQRKSRDNFRKAIKNLGCRKIQKSLWVINKDVYDYIQMLAHEFKIEKYVINIISSQSDIDGILVRMF